jgi:hypothetical protein
MLRVQSTRPLRNEVRRWEINGRGSFCRREERALAGAAAWNAGRIFIILRPYNSLVNESVILRGTCAAFPAVHG